MERLTVNDILNLKSKNSKNFNCRKNELKNLIDLIKN